MCVGVGVCMCVCVRVRVRVLVCIITLVNRWFSKKWRALQPKPVEQIALRLPTSKLPQGKVSLWVDILSNTESTSSPFYDISPPPPIKFEVRVMQPPPTH